jgi:hypothetical protein
MLDKIFELNKKVVALKKKADYITLAVTNGTSMSLAEMLKLREEIQILELESNALQKEEDELSEELNITISNVIQRKV